MVYKIPPGGGGKPYLASGLIMKKRDLFAMKERDLKFNKTVKISSSVANLRNQVMPYGSLDIYL